MTEAEWETSDDPDGMLMSLEGVTTERTLYLLAAACCGELKTLLSKKFISLYNYFYEFADNQYDHKKYRRAWRTAEATVPELGDGYDGFGEAALAILDMQNASISNMIEGLGQARYALALNATTDIWHEAMFEARHEREIAVVEKQAGTSQAHIIRDLFSSRFRYFDPSWRTEAVFGLARGIYESRDFSPMPVLADALEDAGCADADILAHCRGHGPHVRGCWVVDLVLGKE